MLAKLDEKEEWQEWVWPGFYWYQAIHASLAWQKDLQKFGLSITKMVLTYSKGTTAYYFLKNEFETEGRKFFEKIKREPKILFGVLNKIDYFAEKIFLLQKKWGKIDFEKLSDERLLECHRSLFKFDEPLWRNGQVPNLLELGNSYLSDYVKNLITEKFGAENFLEIFAVLTASNYLSVSERQERDFLNLLKQNKIFQLKVEKNLKAHYKKYTWMTYGWAGPALGYDHFLKIFKEALETRNFQIDQLEKKFAERKSILEQQKKILKNFNFTNRTFVILLRNLLESKSKRVDAHSLTFFFADKIMTELGKRVGLSLDQMRVVIPRDVPGLFKKVDVKRINEECNRVLIWFEQSITRKFIGKEAEKKLNYVLGHLPEVGEISEFNGSVAFSGHVKGVVKVILDIKDASKFKRGDVLVTRMTDPSYLFLMKDSSAIVTDVGGITCHAAIVSRELRIPCVIGTKIATKVLKDGDLVEVDAEKGVVKIIKKV